MCLLKIGQRRVQVLVPINPGRDKKRFGIIRQLAASNGQFLTCPVEIASVDRIFWGKTSVEVIASQRQMSLPQVRAHPQRRVRGFLCQLEVLSLGIFDYCVKVGLRFRELAIGEGKVRIALRSLFEQFRFSVQAFIRALPIVLSIALASV